MDGRARAARPGGAARRARAPAPAPGARVRARRRRALGARIVNGTLRCGEVGANSACGRPGGDAQAGRAAIDALPRVAYGGAVAAAKVVVALPPGQVLRKTLTLPAAVEENLRQALAYDLDRHTPFKPDELYFDAVVVARDSRRKEIRVDWAAALKSVVDQARRQAESWGATVVAVTPDVPGGSGRRRSPRSSTCCRRPRAGTAWWRRWQLWVPLAAVGVAAVVAVALPIWQKRDYAIALSRNDRAGTGRRPMPRARCAQQLETMAGDYNFALARKYAFPSAVQVVDDVTKLLPDDTWLTQFEVKSLTKGKDLQREILLRGESGQRRPARVAARGIEAVRQSGAALADDQDPAGPGRDLRPRRAGDPGCRRRSRCSSRVRRLPRRRRLRRRVPRRPTATPTPAPAAQPAATAAPPAAAAAAPPPGTAPPRRGGARLPRDRRPRRHPPPLPQRRRRQRTLPRDCARAPGRGARRPDCPAGARLRSAPSGAGTAGAVLASPVQGRAS